MDMRALLEKMTQFAGQAVGQKPGDQVRGTEKAKRTKGGEHPFKGRLVGAAESVESKSNLLSELDQVAKDTVVERSLAEAWAEFKEEAFKDTEDRRPARKGSREEKVGKRGHKEQERYKTVKEALLQQAKELGIEESRAHKVLDTWFKNRELQDKFAKGELNIPTPAERREQEKKSKEKQAVKEYGADNANPIADPNAAKKAMAATTQIKAVTNTPAPAPNLAKALDAASQGKAVGATDAKVMEPVMDIVKKAATDPKLSNQFKNLAQQAKLIK